MIKSCLFITLLFCFQVVAFSQEKYWQQNVNYKIDVTLNEKDHSLDGFVKMEYTNNSPDTLRYIWIHLWPNAYKNDKTAFSDQYLENGKTDFYFSEKEQRGYINRLDFKVNGITARLEDHPQHIDIGKLILPVLLDPGKTINIATPFHVQLPKNISRGGHLGSAYQVTQWYPKPAVYDKKGWHEMPYLDYGEYFSEYGKYEVQITVPESYIVAATGILLNTDEKQKLIALSLHPPAAKPIAVKTERKIIPPPKTKLAGKNVPVKKVVKPPAPPAEQTKTLRYELENIHDFAWFADREFRVQFDTIKLPSGRSVEAWVFSRPEGADMWKNSIKYTRQSVQTRSDWLGEYPYPVVSVVQAPIGFQGGMEYPTITSISAMDRERDLETVIEHEVGHNWNYAALGNNERLHPWMDEGINDYYDRRYQRIYPDIKKPKMHISGTGLPAEDEVLYMQALKTKRDQPIETPAEKLTLMNTAVITYHKTARWLEMMEKELGREMMDSSMRTFYRQYMYKHPYPEDLQRVFEEVNGKKMDEQFSHLNKTGPLPGDMEKKRSLKIKSSISLRNMGTENYIYLAPAIGYNKYDGLMAGILLHNYKLPSNSFQFVLAPMFATGSSQFAGIGRIGYTWFSKKILSRIELSMTGAKFNVDDFVDSTNNRKFLGVEKFVPSLRIDLRPRDPRSTVTKFIQWKSYFFREGGLHFERDTVRQIDIITYPKTSRYLNQLKLVVDNFRELYPYRAELQFEQGEDFVRAAFEGNYYFNFNKEQGMNMRIFAGKFFYTKDKTFARQYATDRYHFNMTGPNGYEDYSYSNYFVGRNEFEKASSQQIMIRDGGFKVRTDLLASKVGRTDNWLAALNLNVDLPKGLNPLSALPIKIPIKIFFDAGTYAEAWEKNAETGRFLYDAGFQVSLLNNLVNVYFPVMYSKVYRDYFKSTITEKRFAKTISFSIDIHKFNLKKMLGVPLF